MAKYSTQTIARFACLYAGAIWGIFWIPLRAINEVGISGLWSSAIWFMVPTIILLPISFHRWRSIKSGGLRLQITALLSGAYPIFVHACIPLHRRCALCCFIHTDMEHAIGRFCTG